MIGWKYEIGDILKQEYDYRSYRMSEQIYVVDGFYTTRSGTKMYVVINTYGNPSLYDKTAIETTFHLFGKRKCPAEEALNANSSLEEFTSAYGMCNERSRWKL